jgi:hypothetical protein
LVVRTASGALSALPVALAVLATVLATTTACGTVDLGTYEGVRDVRPDENYFYCVVQPQVLAAKRCAGGDPAAGDPANGCHASTSAMRLDEVPTPVACESGRPVGTPSAAERANYAASSLRVNRNAEASPLLAKPTLKVPHAPNREIFAATSPEADLIRKWIAGAR